MDNQTKIEMFRDWTNDFLTVEAFAEHHSITSDHAIRIIEEGRALHNKQAAESIRNKLTEKHAS